MKPATALPWHLDDRSVCGWLDRGGVLTDVETTVCEVFTGEDRDAAYIVHACNHFPELVAALRDLLKAQDDEAGSLFESARARALLAKLGEQP